MSREQTFARWFMRVLIPVALINEAALARSLATIGERREVTPIPQTGPQARSNPGPIFSCTSAGAGVVVSLGMDGKSVFVYCDDVKS